MTDCAGVWSATVPALNNLVTGATGGVHAPRLQGVDAVGLGLRNDGTSGGFYDQPLLGSAYNSADAGVTLLAWMSIVSFSQTAVVVGSISDNNFRNFDLRTNTAGRLAAVVDSTLTTGRTVSTEGTADTNVTNWGVGLGVARLDKGAVSVRWISLSKVLSGDSTWAGEVGGRRAYVLYSGDRNGGPVVTSGATLYVAAVVNRAIGDDELLGDVYPRGFDWFFSADPIRLYSFPSGPIIPTLSAVTMSNILQNSATTNIQLTF